MCTQDIQRICFHSTPRELPSIIIRLAYDLLVFPDYANEARVVLYLVLRRGVLCKKNSLSYNMASRSLEPRKPKTIILTIAT